MAVGGHHGGGTHSGGHHYSGGGHSYGGGGGGHYSGGGGGGSYGYGCNFFVSSAGALVLLIIYMLNEIYEGEVSGLNLINLAIFVISIIFFVISLKQFDRTSILYEIKRDSCHHVHGQVWKGNVPSQKTKYGDNRSWAKYGCYRIAFFDPDYGDENVQKVKELMDRTPKIIWMNPFVWLVIGIISSFSTFFFYEMVIPVFENMIMTDEAFAFIDELVFYTPSLITLLSALACFIFVRVKDNLLYQCALTIVKDNEAQDLKLKTESEIASALSRKWYHNVCPNCGAPASRVLRNCTSCGSSLEVKSFDSGNTSAVHRISAKAENDTGKEKA